MTTVKINDWVERLGSSKDYTTGRVGRVEEIKDDRCRVRWMFEKNGGRVHFGTQDPGTGNGVRTWVNKKFLKLKNEQV